MKKTKFANKYVKNLQEALNKKEEPLSCIDQKIVEFADKQFEGNVEWAKEYIFRFYFDLQNKKM